MFYLLKVKNERNGGIRTILTSQDYNEIVDYIKRHGEVGNIYYLYNRNYEIVKKLKRNDKKVIELQKGGINYVNTYPSYGDNKLLSRILLVDNKHLIVLLSISITIDNELGITNFEVINKDYCL